ncbi:hypothetical protein [Candidatus Nitrosocosmicus sp. T]
MTKPNHKSGRWVIIVGFVLVILGILFHLQSNSLIGPASSFMYANPEWTFNGLIIIAIGISIIVIGLSMKSRRNKNQLIS